MIQRSLLLFCIVISLVNCGDSTPPVFEEQTSLFDINATLNNDGNGNSTKPVSPLGLWESGPVTINDVTYTTRIQVNGPNVVIEKRCNYPAEGQTPAEEINVQFKVMSYFISSETSHEIHVIGGGIMKKSETCKIVVEPGLFFVDGKFQGDLSTGGGQAFNKLTPQ